MDILDYFRVYFNATIMHYWWSCDRVCKSSCRLEMGESRPFDLMMMVNFHSCGVILKSIRASYNLLKSDNEIVKHS